MWSNGFWENKLEFQYQMNDGWVKSVDEEGILEFNVKKCGVMQKREKKFRFPVPDE